MREVSASLSKGRHTTTVRELFPLDGGGYVADMPGMRSLALWDTEAEELDGYFPELAPLVCACQFSNCTHKSEPGCAVRAAVEAGTVSPGATSSYIRLTGRGGMTEQPDRKLGSRSGTSGRWRCSSSTSPTTPSGMPTCSPARPAWAAAPWPCASPRPSTARSRPPRANPCGICRTCRQIDAMQYPDLAIVQAEKEGGVLKVEQVRGLRQSLALKPYQGSYRVALFLRFQEANPNAANALLKTLEEAPAHVVLLLTADNAEQLLPTIVSRCEVLRLRPMPVQAVDAHLLKQGADTATARLLAHVSGGRPGYALRLMADKEGLDFRSRRLDDLERLLHGTRRERFSYAEKLADRRGETRASGRATPCCCGCPSGGM